ncbi:MAG: hypothetical protein ACOWWR_10885 [Eubacteriales bacterium]
MANDSFPLPCSSVGEIIKIIIGYTNSPGETSLDSISKLTGIDKTRISKNSKFLTVISIIEGGQKKKITENGSKLGRAFEHRIEQEIQNSLKEIIGNTEFLSNLITTIRIKSGMSADDFSKHILFASNSKDTKEAKTGSKAIIEILEMAGYIKEENGVFTTPNTDEKVPNASKKIDEKIEEAEIDKKKDANNADLSLSKKASDIFPSLNINIELHLPISENIEVYENIFKAMRRHLIDGEP